ncbi:MAG: hypothetical protein RL701_734 [Pseudomonadota bacterium]|jgi:hypothetical protein
MTRTRLLTLCLLALLGSSACAARSAEVYRTDVRRLLDTKRAILQACYEAELQNQPTAAGKVVVHFRVERELGHLLNPQVDDLQSTPNRTLRGCVLEALNGLVLTPPDDRHGAATFTWDFQISGVH